MSTAKNIFSHSPIPTPRQIARGELNSVRVKVFGYWSGDSITVYCRVDYFRDSALVVEITHSSGGRDTNEIACGIEAEENFAHGLLGAAALARKIQSMSDEVAAEYKIYKEELRIEAEKETAERQARIDADPPMPQEIVDHILTVVGSDTSFKLYVRGSTRPNHDLTKSGRFFYLDSTRISRKELESTLMTLSARYTQFN